MVASGLDPFSFDCFYVINQRDLVETARVSNLLGRDDPKGGGRLRRAVVSLTAVVGEGADAVEVDLGSHKLAPRDADGSSKEVPFIKPRQGKVRLKVKGTAEYDNGVRDLAGEADGPNIEIRDSMLLMNPS